ncbi:MAG: apolipoprotein N-acyltransferase [Blastocatellia bacterium]|nr:apolipoprotein N-acyltransferase [Blastocatellia bacterium]
MTQATVTLAHIGRQVLGWLAGPLAAALLLVLAFPPFSLWPLAGVAVAPLLRATLRTARWWSAFLQGWLTGTLFYYFSAGWISHSMIHYGEISFPLAHLLTLAVAATLGFFTGLFTLAIQVTSRYRQEWGLVAAPFAWVTAEFLRLNLAEMGWNHLGYALARQPLLIQIARFTSVLGVSFWLVAIASGLLYALWGKKQALQTGVGFVILILLIVADGWRTVRALANRPAAGTVDVVAVQPLVPVLLESERDYQEALTRHLALSGQGLTEARSAVRVTVWPESQMGFRTDDETEPARAVMQALTRERQTYLLFNGIRRADERFYNLAALMNPDGTIKSEYRKVHLLPFGEYIPLRSLFSQIGFTPLAIDAQPATQPTVTVLEKGKIGASICFESTFPSLSADLRRQGAGVFINIANDGWFGHTAASAQHLNHLIFRAVENQLDTVRVTNTGTSACILANGSVREHTALFVPVVRTWTVSLRSEGEPLTFYAAHGDLFAWLCGAVTVVAMVSGQVYSRGRNKKST